MYLKCTWLYSYDFPYTVDSIHNEEPTINEDESMYKDKFIMEVKEDEDIWEVFCAKRDNGDFK